jgi:hypothetical protein
VLLCGSARYGTALGIFFSAGSVFVIIIIIIFFVFLAVVFRASGFPSAIVNSTGSAAGPAQATSGNDFHTNHSPQDRA